MKRLSVLLLAGLAAGLFAMASARAQDYPTRQITLIAPWPAGGAVDVLCREEPIAKSDTVARVIASGGRVHVPSEIAAAAHEGDGLRLTLSNSTELRADYVIVQIGFLSAKETFERLGLRLNEDGSIAIDPYFETSRHGIFALGSVEPLRETSPAYEICQSGRHHHRCGTRNRSCHCSTPRQRGLPRSRGQPHGSECRSHFR